MMGTYKVTGGSFVECHFGDLVYNFSNGKSDVTSHDVNIENYNHHLQQKYARSHDFYTEIDVVTLGDTTNETMFTSNADRIPADTAFRNSRKLFLFGVAGAGKTAFLKNLLYQYSIGDVLNREFQLCIYVELSRYVIYPSLSPLQSLAWLICQSLSDCGALDAMPSIDGCLALLREIRAILLMDGLNEVSMQYRDDCLVAISDLSERYQQHHYVVSSRLHQVTPPSGWASAMLDELNDLQMEDFLSRYVGEQRTQHVKELINLAKPNYLTRNPLYLYFITKLFLINATSTQLRLSSRSRLVDAYVQHLFTRDKRMPSAVTDQLRAASELLAWTLQGTGQSIRQRDACLAIANMVPGGDGERQQALIQLSAMGILRIDGEHIRFWHQTLQDYFLAGAVINQSRAIAHQAGRPRNWLKSMLRDPQYEESLCFLVVYLTDKELRKTVPQIILNNPHLAVSWLDDLSSERRDPTLLKQTIRRYQRQIRVGLRYSYLYSNGLIDFFGFLLALSAVLSVAAVAFGGVTTLLRALLGLSSSVKITFQELLVQSFASAVSLSILFGFFRWRNGRISLSSDKLHVHLAALLSMRNPDMKESMQPLLNRICHSWLARSDIKALGRAILNYHDEQKPIELLKRDQFLYLNIKAIGYVRGGHILDILIQILSSNNVYALAASRALAMRATRFPEERKVICEVMWKLWSDRTKDWQLRAVARHILIGCRQNPGGQLESIKQSLREVVGAFAIMVLFAYILMFLFDWAGFRGSLASVLIASGCRTDARDKKAINIVGYFGIDGCSPRFWYWSGMIGGCFTLILYLITCERIRRNSLGISSYLHGDA